MIGALLSHRQSNKINSTFANGEVKGFKEVREVREVREVKAICFIANLQQKKAIGYNFLRPKGVTTA